MQTTAPQPHPEQKAELPALNIIRTETVLSRYPIHKLAKHGSIDIGIREENEHGELKVRWKVSYNSEFGQPGPLAYKLDTLVINRRIEEAERPIPKIIKLGSLRDICQELGVTEGENLRTIKKALYQNAFAGITARITYRTGDGREQKLEAAFTRYTVILTGEKFPDGRTADGVYLILNDVFIQVINGARTRPLNYDYLKELAPAPQRFYELLSYQIFAALKNNRPRAKLAYSEYCTYAPQTRYFDFDHVKKQMYKLHAPHRKSGYIADVEFQVTTDREDRPDWLMLYTPGPKAKAEYRAFTRKGGLVLELEPAAVKATTEAKPNGAKVEAEPTAEPTRTPTELEAALIARGVTPATAAALQESYPAEHIRARIEAFDWLVGKKDKRVSKSPGGYLADSIRKGYTAPKGFESKADQEKRLQAEAEQRRRAEEAKRRSEAEEKAREEAEQARIWGYWESLLPAEQETLKAEALASADSFFVGQYKQRLRSDPKAADFWLKMILGSHLTRLLDARATGAVR